MDKITEVPRTELPFSIPRFPGTELASINLLSYHRVQIGDADLTKRHELFNMWLQIQCYWYHVLSNPQFTDESYDLIKDCVIQMERDDLCGELKVPRRECWNYLPDRYDDVVVRLFAGIPLKMRKPWQHGEGVYRNAMPQLDRTPLTPVPKRGVSKARFKKYDL